MFSIRKNGIYKLHSARSFVTEKGEKGSVMLFLERENQPTELERPSKASNPIKVWCAVLPEKVKDGCMLQLVDFEGFDWKHVPSKRYMDKNGNPVYEELIELVAPTFKVIENN